jgi:hypothetical protein
VLRRHDGNGRVNNYHATLGPRGDFVMALRAEVVGFLEPVGHARDAGQADTEKATEDTGNTVSTSSCQRGHQKQATTVNSNVDSHLHRCALGGDPRHSSLVAKGAVDPLRAVPELINGNYTGDCLLCRHRCRRMRLMCVQVCRHVFHGRRLLAGVCRLVGSPWSVCRGRGLDVRCRRGGLGLLLVFLHFEEWDMSGGSGGPPRVASVFTINRWQ